MQYIKFLNWIQIENCIACNSLKDPLKKTSLKNYNIVYVILVNKDKGLNLIEESNIPHLSCYN